MKQKFRGSMAKHNSYFGFIEKKIVKKATPLIPNFIETYHLTLATFPLSLLVLFFSFKAKNNSIWLIGVGLCVFSQYLTDLFDGAVGRYRKTGLVKWGFFMDHFFDYVFVSFVVVGWMFILPIDYFIYIIFTQIIWAGIMINSFLYFGATNRFRVNYTKVGPTEFRILIFLIYAGAAIFGNELFIKIVPILTIGSALFLMALIYDAHKNIWRIDKKSK